MPSLHSLTSDRRAPWTSTRRTLALSLACLAFLAILILGMAQFVIDASSEPKDLFLFKRQFQLGSLLGGGAEHQGIPMISAASDVQNLIPTDHLSVEPSAAPLQPAPSGYIADDLEGNVIGLSGRLETSSFTNTAATASSTGQQEPPNTAFMTLQSLSLGANTILESTFRSVIYAATGGSIGAEALSTPLTSNPTPILSSDLVGDAAGPAAAGQETGRISYLSQLGDITRQPSGVDTAFSKQTASQILPTAAPTPSNVADILNPTTPLAAGPLCETVEGCLPLNSPAQARSLSIAIHDGSDINKHMPNSMGDSANSVNGQLCVVRQIVAGVLREVITPCSVVRANSASPDTDTAPSTVQEGSMTGSSGDIPENVPYPAPIASGQIPASGSPTMKLPDSGNVRQDELTSPLNWDAPGQSTSGGSSGVDPNLGAARLGGSGSLNGWSDAGKETPTLGTPTAYNRLGDQTQVSGTLGCPAVDPIPCPACPTCISCSQTDNDNQVGKPGLGPCPERGFQCAECLDGWFCPPKETPAQPVPCGLGWPCYHCTSGWFCELVFTPEPTITPSEPRPNGGIVGSQGANDGLVPHGGSGVGSGSLPANYPVPGTNSPYSGNLPAPGQTPAMDPIPNGAPIPNDGSNSNPGSSPNQGPIPGNGQAPGTPATPTNSLIPGTVPVNMGDHATTPLPIPGSAPILTQLPVPSTLPSHGTDPTPGNEVTPGDNSVPNNNPSPVVVPLPNAENGGMPNHREPITSGWNNLGCFQDSISRTLLGAKPADYLRGAMSNDLCIQHCSSRGYSIAGTENGQECWCGTAIREDAIRLPENYCGTPCQGGSGTVCGGSWAVMVFNRYDAIAQQPFPPEYGLVQRDSETKRKESRSTIRRPFRERALARLGEANHKIGIREMRHSKRRGAFFAGENPAFDVDSAED
ncbi:hypothetical protein EDB80DRAFT_89661 [Ilyonectria destructans]|nr:hypothetical protein EDB80DRAFT_89661 [Ilyonectria destructans]